MVTGDRWQAYRLVMSDPSIGDVYIRQEDKKRCEVWVLRDNKAQVYWYHSGLMGWILKRRLSDGPYRKL